MDIITANRLKDGLVVFQAAGGWSYDIREAEVLDGKETVAAALQRAETDAARNIVVDPYPVAVTLTAAGIVPTRLRERIRADGPTTGNSKSPAATHRDEAA
jgi:hypothetical protein